LCKLSANMAIEISDEKKKHGEATEKGFNGIQVILGLIMYIIGYNYLPSLDAVVDAALSESSIPSKEDNPCPNGAAYYLYVAGIVILVINLVNILSKAAKKWAEKDGKVTCMEQCGLTLLTAAGMILGITDIALLIWGSVVVFGAWSGWTYDYDEWVVNHADPNVNYCEYSPMMTAFFILIIKWLIIPIMITLWCCCGCLITCCTCCMAAIGLKAASDAIEDVKVEQEATESKA